MLIVREQFKGDDGKKETAGKQVVTAKEKSILKYLYRRCSEASTLFKVVVSLDTKNQYRAHLSPIYLRLSIGC